MRAAVPALLLGSIVPLVAAQPEPAPPPRELKPDPARDLKLVAEPLVDRIVHDAPPEGRRRSLLVLTLVNTSKTFTYPVVEPNDGSEAGWREPYVYLTGERLADGGWVPLDRAGGGGRCGLYAFDWTKDVVELKPGGSLLLSNGWVSPPDLVLPWPGGRIRVRGHYDYRGGVDKSQPRPVAGRGRMGDTPPFALASDPVGFDVLQAYELKVAVKRAVKAGVEYKLSELFDATLTNNTDAPAPVRAGGDDDPRFDAWVEKPAVEILKVAHAGRYGAVTELKPGATLSVLGAGDLANGADGTWTAPKPGKYTFRVGFAISKDITPSPRRTQVIVELTAE